MITNITVAQPQSTMTGGGGILGALGLNLGNAVVNAGIQQGQNAMNSRRSYKYGIKGMKEQLRMETAEMPYRIKMQQDAQKEMWDYTNYENQMEHIKNAGLNPGLLYGIGGGGGQTVGAGAPGVSANAPSGGNQGSGMGISMQEVVQTRLMEAQAKKIEAETENLQQGTKKTWQETHKLEMDNLIQEISQNVDKDGKNTEGNIHNSAAVTQMKQQIEESAKRIELLRQQGLTEKELQEKINNETKLLQNEIDWQALEITGENTGSVIEKVMKIIVGMITGAKGLKGTPAKAPAKAPAKKQ